MTWNHLEGISVSSILKLLKVRLGLKHSEMYLIILSAGKLHSTQLVVCTQFTVSSLSA